MSTWADLALCVQAWQASSSPRNAERLLRVASKVSYTARNVRARPDWWWRLAGEQLEVAIWMQADGLSIREGARRLKVHPPALSRWLRGQSGRREAALVEGAIDRARRADP